MGIRREAICGVFLFEARSKSSVRCTVPDGAKIHSQKDSLEESHTLEEFGYAQLESASD